MKIMVEIDMTLAQLLLIALRNAEDKNIGDDCPFDQIEPRLEKRREYEKRFREYNGDPEIFQEEDNPENEFLFVNPNYSLGMLRSKIYEKMRDLNVEVVADTFDPYSY